MISVGSNLKIPNLEPSEPPETEPRTYRTSSLLLRTEPTEPPKNRTQPRTLLNRMAKMGDSFEVFSLKPNLEPTEPLVCPQKLNLEPTEPRIEPGSTQH